MENVNVINGINIDENMAMVYHIATKYFKGHNILTKEDMLQYGTIGLIKAAKTYKKDKGAFSTFAFPSIIGSIKTGYRISGGTIGRRTEKDKGEASVISAFSDFSFKDDNGRESAERMEAAFGLYQTGAEEEIVNRIVLKDAISKLTDKEKELIELYFFKDVKQSEMAKKYNVSQTQISRMLKRTLKKLRESIGEQ